MIRIGLSSAAFYGRMETDDSARHLRRFPVDTCEVFLETYSEYSADFARLVRHRLGGLHVSSVHPKGTDFEPNLFGQSVRQVEDAMRLFTGMCDAGHALGAKWYVFHGPGSIVTQRRPDNIPHLTERISRMQSIAAARSMALLWENVSWCSVRLPEDVAAVRRLLPGMGFVLDVKQAYRAHSTPAELLTAMGEQVRHVHALDIDAQGKLVFPGQGVTDWRVLASQLRDLGFDGSVILEPYTVQPGEEAALCRSLDLLREIFLT